MFFFLVILVSLWMPLFFLFILHCRLHLEKEVNDGGEVGDLYFREVVDL